MNRSRGFVVCSALCSAGLLAACSGPLLPAPTESAGQDVITAAQIYGNSLPPKMVVLTYDDGPDEHTLELAHYLADNGIHATFFENGRRFCKTYDASGNCITPQDTRACDDGGSQAAVPGVTKHYPESLIDQVLALGHRVGNHSQDHCHLQMETKVADVQWELKTTQDIIQKHICDNVFLFRTPYGEWDASVAGRINMEADLNKIVGPINWDIDGEDWSCWQTGVTPQACADKYLSMLNARPNKNGIFLMHDRPEFNVGYEGPLLMAKIIVPKLKADGFKFGSMDDVLKLTPNPNGSGCPNAAPADAGAPDSAGATDAAQPSADAGAGGSSSGGSGAGNSGGSSGPDQPTGSGGSTTSGSGGSGSGAGGASGGATGSDSSSGGSGGRSATGSGGSPGSGQTGNDSQPSNGGGCSLGGSHGQQPAAPLTLLLGLAGIGLARGRRRRDQVRG